jgi:Fe(3+) dicitrate transport protein
VAFTGFLFAVQANAWTNDHSGKSGDGKAKADSVKRVESTVRILDRVMVVGDPAKIDAVPGAAHYISKEELEKQKVGYDDINRVLRQVPGVYVQDEEGFGLRPNIGMRGTGVERSSKITVMEDGVLIAPAPYAAPAAYYFPVTGRMEAIEVRKGSSQIKHGPRTNGGALNLISTKIPYDFDWRLNLTAGSNRTGKLHATLGDSRGNFGWLLETYLMRTDGFKRLDGGGNTGFDLKDYIAKVRVSSDPDARVYQELELKLGLTDEQSNETYLGLTSADFQKDPYRRYAASQKDVLDARHEQFQARHFIQPTENIDVTTILYRNNFRRNWYKLDKVGGKKISAIVEDPAAYASLYEILVGGDSAPDALTVKANNRKYYSQGVQTVVGIQIDSRRASHEIELGLRYHEDQEDRFQWSDKYQMSNGAMVLTTSGIPGQAGGGNNRVNFARAWAFFAQDRISLGNWIITPGLRYEKIRLVRRQYAKGDPARTTAPQTTINDLDVLIPGIGAAYKLNADVSIFGGIHKGFGPPGPGANDSTEAEKSTNYELGVRYGSNVVNAQIVGFFNDYDNLLGKDTFAAGGTGSGEVFNGGEVRVVGLEASLSYDFGIARNLGMSIPARLAYTFTDAEFRNGFASKFGPWGNVTAGDKLPYVPVHQFSASIGLQKQKWGIFMRANFVDKMRTQASQGPIPESQSTDARWVVDVSAEYAISGASKAVLSVQNVTNRSYVVARRPAGLRPGLPRTLTAGIRFAL